jgi:hypothetical protein
MLNRFRDFVKRLELPQDEVVHRIIDDDLNTVEVTAAQYALWRMNNDVAMRAIVGQDTIENVMVRTTFSIMPENRSYKPFGTSAYEMPLYDPLTEYSQRYDTWNEAEQGHRNTLERIRRDNATARAAERRVESLAGTAGEARLAITADLPAMFQVNVHSESEVTILTPLARADGTLVELAVSAGESGFTLADASRPTLGDSGATLQGLEGRQVERMTKALGVSVESGALVFKADDASELGRAIIGLAQAVAWLSLMAGDKS